jgi:predicted dehydrogenase
MTRALNVGMIGYGFMAKAHSNAWRRVANFFPEVERRPVLKVVAARSAEKVGAFAEVWGYEGVETDWRRLVARDDMIWSTSACPTTRIRRSRSPQRRPANGSRARSRSR